MGKEWDPLQNSLTEFYKGLSHRLALAQITDITVYQAIAIKSCLQTLWQILASLSQILYFQLSENDTHGLL